jgi:phage regulator Rha-like protein
LRPQDSEALVSSVAPSERIEKAILFVRGHKVLLDEDLAKLYGVTVGRLNEAVKRNIERFPDDFMFQLTFHELRALRSQIAISKKGRGGRRYMPYAFTEHGAIMAANVLNTQRAIEVSMYVVRTFVRLRQLLATNKELARKLAELERKLENHDDSIRSLFDAIRQLMTPATFSPAHPETAKTASFPDRRDAGSDSAGRNQSNGHCLHSRLRGIWGSQKGASHLFQRTEKRARPCVLIPAAEF